MIDARKSGWVKIHRSLLEHPLVTQLPDAWLKVFLVILLKVNWSPATWWNGAHEIEIPAGSMITSVEKLAQISRASGKQVRGCLEYLRAANMAAIETTNRYTRLTILNWDTYQSMETVEGEQDGEQEGKERANKGQAEGEQDGNNIRNKELRKEHRSNSVELDRASKPSRKTSNRKRAVDPDIQRWFDAEFWPIYPRHEGKVKALEAAGTKATTPERRAFYVARLRTQLPAYLQRKTESGQRVIPLASTWFNQDRAEDELQPAPEQGGRRPATADVDYPEYQGIGGGA